MKTKTPYRRITTFVTPKYSNVFDAYCEEREQKPAEALRHIIREYFDRMVKG